MCARFARTALVQRRDVHADAGLLREPLATVLALERLGLGVHDLVALQLALAVKQLAAVEARLCAYTRHTGRACIDEPPAPTRPICESCCC